MSSECIGYISCLISISGILIGRKGPLTIMKVVTPILLAIMWYLGLSQTIIGKYTKKEVGIDLGLKLTEDTKIFIVIILMIGILVLEYSSDYLKYDPTINRFIGIMLFFIQNMLIFVISSTYYTLFTVWEWLGIGSGMLISYWYFNNNNILSANKALFVNRFGDFALILLLLSQYLYSGSLHLKLMEISGMESLLMVVGILSKSGQLIFHIWLVDAMAAPTPVSSLLHAATMVTAGLYLMIKLYFRPIFISNLILVVLTMGTIIFAGYFASSIKDFKKSVAFSTSSQLALMGIALSIGLNNSAIYHLYTHAYFKADLFLTAGSFIHSINDNQIIQKYFNFLYLMPISASSFIISSLSLASLPFFSGLYSKEAILDNLYLNNSELSSIAWYCIVLSIIFTAFYSIRPMFYLFRNLNNYYVNLYNVIHESAYPILKGLFILSIFSILFGFYYKAEINSDNVLDVFYQLIPLLLTIICISLYLFGFYYWTSFYAYMNKSFLFFKGWFEILFVYNAKFFLDLSYIFNFRLFDKGFTYLYSFKFFQTIIFKCSYFYNAVSINYTKVVLFFIFLIIADIVIIYYVCF